MSVDEVPSATTSRDSAGTCWSCWRCSPRPVCPGGCSAGRGHRRPRRRVDAAWRTWPTGRSSPSAPTGTWSASIGSCAGSSVRRSGRTADSTRSSGRRRRWWTARWCRPTAPGRERHVGEDLVAQVDALAEAVEARAGRGDRRRRPRLAVLRLRQWSVRHLYHAYDPARAIALGDGHCGPTANACWAPTIPDTLATLHGLASALKSAGGPRRRSTCTSGRPATGRGCSARTPGHARVPQQPGRRLPDRGRDATRRSRCTSGPWPTGTRVLGADHRRHVDLAQQSRVRLPRRRTVAEAIALYERTIADRTRVLGADHPDTFTPAAAWPTPTWWRGRPDDAVSLHERVAADRERVLGPDHPRRADLAQRPGPGLPVGPALRRGAAAARRRRRRSRAPAGRGPHVDPHRSSQSRGRLPQRRPARRGRTALRRQRGRP